MSKPQNPAQRAAVLKAKRASPWSKHPHCATPRAEYSYGKYVKRGKA